MSKTFILQKPLPDSEVGDEYIYNGTYGRYYKNGNVQDSYWGTESVENNPEWFKLKEEQQPKEKDVFQWTREVLQEFVQYCDRNWKGKVRFDEVAESFIQSKSTPKEDKIIPATIDEEAFKNRCTCCGSNLVLIRGKYPKEDKRQTCPTCTTERIEQINEISNKDYGKTYKNN